MCPHHDISSLRASRLSTCVCGAGGLLAGGLLTCSEFLWPTVHTYGTDAPSEAARRRTFSRGPVLGEVVRVEVSG